MHDDIVIDAEPRESRLKRAMPTLAVLGIFVFPTAANMGAAYFGFRTARIELETEKLKAALEQ